MTTEECFKQQKLATQKYGEKAVVLTQIGNFYEIFEWNLNGSPGRNEQSVGHAVKLSEIMNMVLTSADKSKPHSMTNPRKIGFPIPTYERHRDVLLSHNYTVLRFDEFGDDTPRIRKLVEVISPGTNIDIVTVGSSVVCIYLEFQKKLRPEIRTTRECEDILVAAGMSSIDITTGKVMVSESVPTGDNAIFALHEAFRFLVMQNPKEVVIFMNSFENQVSFDLYKTFLTEILELNRYPNVFIRVNGLLEEFLRVSYQTQFFNKIYGQKNFRTENIIEQLDLEKYTYGRISCLGVLQYVYERNETLLLKIQRPDVLTLDTEHLTLLHNAVIQLHIVSSGHSLFQVVDFTKTLPGKRLLKQRLLSPLVNVEVLKASYLRIGELVKDTAVYDQLNKHLRDVPDIEKLHRRLTIGNIRPNELAALLRAYYVIGQMSCLIHASSCLELKKILLTPEVVKDFNVCMEKVLNYVNVDVLEQCTLTELPGKKKVLEAPESFIRSGIDAQVDELTNQYQRSQGELTAIVNHLTGLLSGTKGAAISIMTPSQKGKPEDLPELEDEEATEEDEPTLAPILCTTQYKAKRLREKMNQIKGELVGKLEFPQYKKSKSHVQITSTIIERVCQNVAMTKNVLMTTLQQKYHGIIEYMTTNHKFFGPVTVLLAMIDFTMSGASVAKKYKYYCPEIDDTQGASYVKIDEMRHPLVERIIDSEYIPNDITLGEKEGYQGMLLFGCNSAGKTVRTKGIGSNVILAQAGLWTAGKMKFRPFSQLITRISGEDDMLKGHSSFIVEGLELRTILRNANTTTLVLGDELTRGTESASGTGISAAAILTLINRGTCFVFSSHMHNLPGILEERMKDKKKLRICHLGTSFDEVKKVLVYDRRLQEGPGPSIYGIEVLKSLCIDAEFLNLANEIRRTVDGIPNLIVATKTSRYNNDLYVDICELCGKQQNLETHHIREQHKADEKGFIGHHHKDAQFNLLVLCRECHQRLHREKKEIETKQTLQGQMIQGT